MKFAGDGGTKEDWIAEVLSGHGGDEAAQLGCLTEIVKLWRGGPWPWLAERGG